MSQIMSSQAQTSLFLKTIRSQAGGSPLPVLSDNGLGQEEPSTAARLCLGCIQSGSDSI